LKAEKTSSIANLLEQPELQQLLTSNQPDLEIGIMQEPVEEVELEVKQDVEQVVFQMVHDSQVSQSQEVQLISQEQA
jgi:hypothetical protein